MSSLRATTHANAAPAAASVGAQPGAAGVPPAVDDLRVTSNGGAAAPNNSGNAAPSNGGNAAPSNGAAHLPVTRNSLPADLGRTARLVRTTGRDPAIAAFESAVVGYFLEAADILGVPKSVAAIYGICFASPEPLSFSDINERLDISAGSISQGLRVLREIGALRMANEANPARLLNPEAAEGAENSSAHHGRATNNGGEAAPNNDGPDLTPNPLTAPQAPLLAAARGRSARATRYAPDMELRKLALHYMEHRLQRQLASGHAQLRALSSAVPDRRVGERIAALETWHEKAEALLPIARAFLRG